MQPAKPDAIRKRIQHYAGLNEPTEFPPKKWGAMIGWLNRYLITNKLRRLVLGWLFAFPGEKFEPLSSTTLTPQQKNGISKWVGSWLNEDTQEWETRPTFQQECIAVLNAARYDWAKVCGQMTIDLPFEIEGEPAGLVKSYIEDMQDPAWDPELNSEKKSVTGIAV